MPETETPLHGLAAMDQTQEIQTRLPAWKRVRLWGLLGFAVILILWEADKQCGGTVFAWLGLVLGWTMNHAIFPGVVGVMLGHYCWPLTIHVLPRMRKEQDHSR